MKIIFFDGYCNLCNGLIDFLVKVDRNHELKFASLQGETAKKLGIAVPENVEASTVIYLRNEIRYEKSEAILRIFSDLGGFWKIAGAFSVVPKLARDFAYASVAKNRYSLFGKSNSCRIPTPEEQSNFLP